MRADNAEESPPVDRPRSPQSNFTRGMVRATVPVLAATSFGGEVVGPESGTGVGAAANSGSGAVAGEDVVGDSIGEELPPQPPIIIVMLNKLNKW